ncbi:apolipoprotein A-I-like [Pygocentrus nattereri]|uniref:apolipoprotein A-I-like n=1 Tax=Pygocentrus nattereri TaxID=42514 RepID=UPI001891834A|nr:apolipoprotein A-I-like [Pygocentrus nattereri]
MQEGWSPTPSQTQWPAYINPPLLEFSVIHRSTTSKTSAMKVVALALTLLLALGSYARSLQADAPSQLEHYKAAAMVYLDQVKDHASKALEHLGGSEYDQYKQKLTESLDTLQQYAQLASHTLSPYTTHLIEGTKQVREHIVSELEDLRFQVEPHRFELQQAIEKHIEEYREKLGPILQEYLTSNQEDLEALHLKLQPVFEDLRQKVETKLEETKSKLVPIVEAVRAKLTKQLLDIRNMATPYADEYKEHVLKAVEDVKEKLAPHTTELQGHLEPYLETVKARLTSIYDSVVQAMSA